MQSLASSQFHGLALPGRKPGAARARPTRSAGPVRTSALLRKRLPGMPKKEEPEEGAESTGSTGGPSSFSTFQLKKQSDIKQEEPKWTLTPSVGGTGKKVPKVPTITLEEGDVLTVGRQKGPGIDVVVPVPCVSGEHMEFSMRGGRLYARDLGSTNGTYIDGFEVRAKNENGRRVFDGGNVRLGAENFEGEQFVLWDAELTGASEQAKNSEYGQLEYFIEFVGGPRVVFNFLIVNVLFQLGFYLLVVATNDK